MSMTETTAPSVPRNLRDLTAADEIIRPRNLPVVTGLSRTTIWRLERSGDFPPQIQLSAGAVGYLATEVRAWRESRQTGKGKCNVHGKQR